jgi:uncharacterized membrane protein YfcA
VLDPQTALICASALFLGGFTKGIAGLGLPMIAIPLLAFAVKLPTAVALLVLPTVVSNLFQAFQRGAFLPVVQRFWTLLIVFVPAIALGAELLVSVDERILYVVLGIAILAITVLIRLAPRFAISRATERWLSPFAGALAGLLGGASSLFGPVIMIYLLTLRMEKREYIATVSLLYCTGAASFGIALTAVGGFGRQQALYSALALAPVFAGMLIGQKIGDRLDRRNFERTLHVLYVMTALTFFYKAFV